MTKQDTINANVCLLAQQAHDAGVESGTVLHYRTGDAPEPVSPVTLMGCTFTYQGLDDDKALLGCKLKDKLLGTAPVDNVEPMRFATCFSTCDLLRSSTFISSSSRREISRSFSFPRRYISFSTCRIFAADSLFAFSTSCLYCSATCSN